MSNSISAALSFLETSPLAESHPTLKSNYERKLWHQFTLQVLDILSSSDITSTFSTIEFYNSVIGSVAKKLNPLSLARIAGYTASSIAKEGDLTSAIALLETVDLGDAVAPITFVESKLVTLKLLASPNDTNVLEEVRKMLSKGKERLQLSGDSAKDSSATKSTYGVVKAVTSGSDMALVYAAYYEASMLYRKHVGPPEAFYQEALNYLNYTSVSDIPGEDAYTLATDLSLAALTGEGVFHFGEVVLSLEILKVLKGTQNEWLMELMRCCADGDVGQFMAVTNRPDVQEKIQAQPALTARADAVKEKIVLLSLINLVFERPSHERKISFEEIATRCMLSSTKDVEKVVMRALSLGLIRGEIDQVDQEVFIYWVMPRVLDTSQMMALSKRFGEWAVKSSKVADHMIEHASHFS